MTPDIASPTRNDLQAKTGTGSEAFPPHRILLVSPSPPPYGGMALQGRLLERLLRGDGNEVVFFATNAPLPAWLHFAERLPLLRTAARLVVTWPNLWKQAGRADVIHILAASWVYFFLVVYPAVLVGWARGRKVILNYRGGAAERFFRFYGWAIGPAFRFAEAITAPSEFLARPIRKRFGVAVSIVPNILDTSAFPYQERVAIRPRMLVNRHLDAIYDVESVLRAFALVQKRYSEASLWIAGTGPEEERLRGLVSAWKLQNVRFLGHVRHRDLRAVYDQCDILMNASRIDNFPGALLEASSAGLVVVSTRAGGIPFIYQDGKSALLVEVGNWSGLARAAETVLEEPLLAGKLTKAALRALQACEWTEVRKCLYRSYGFASLSAHELKELRGNSDQAVSSATFDQIPDDFSAEAPGRVTACASSSTTGGAGN